MKIAYVMCELLETGCCLIFCQYFTKGEVIMKRRWVRYEDPNNKYGATFTLGNKSVDLPKDAVVSVTRGENFNIPRTRGKWNVKSIYNEVHG